MNILSLSQKQISDIITSSGFPAFRAKQIISWLNKGTRSFDEMTNLPAGLITYLKDTYTIYKPKVLSKLVSDIDGTVKYLWELEDGNAVETVIMRYDYGNTICISTQVGCRQGCLFCASTLGGLIRNLEPYEMLDEVMFSQIDSGIKISNIVLMGIGEPLDNYENVMSFLQLVNNPDALNIGMRHISLSTCGIVDKIYDLADRKLQLTLSVSLHAPDDLTRSQIMPSNKRYGVQRIINSCYDYYKKTGRRISFEYAMISGVNDSDEQAIKLAELARKVHAHVNLIPLNHVDERSLIPSQPERISAFKRILTDRGINVTVRRSLGGDVNASCGQLRRKFIN